jgi:hypothetical protein
MPCLDAANWASRYFPGSVLNIAAICLKKTRLILWDVRAIKDNL